MILEDDNELQAQAAEDFLCARKLESVKYRHFHWTTAQRNKLEEPLIGRQSLKQHLQRLPEMREKGVGRISLSHAMSSEWSGREGSSVRQKL